VLSLVLLLSGWPGATRAETLAYVPPVCAGDPRASEAALLACFAPVFVAPEAERSFNRIGTPALEGDRAVVRPDVPTLYAEVRHDRVGERDLLHLVYRIHFERIPWSWSWRFYEAHRNPGQLLVVTLDARDQTPLLVTSVHTCGCYRAVLPTGALPESARPPGWPADKMRVYGERLPSVLRAPASAAERITVHLRPHSHRVTHLEVSGELPPEAQPVSIPIEPIANLRALRGDDGRVRSFFYERGPLRGHVRGAWNPFEGLTLFGFVALDPTVGMDKDMGDPEQTGTPFYTMLRFWKHDESRLDRYGPLLDELGFELDGDAARGE
jgi:hypothetical protein